MWRLCKLGLGHRGNNSQSFLFAVFIWISTFAFFTSPGTFTVIWNWKFHSKIVWLPIFRPIFLVWFPLVNSVQFRIFSVSKIQNSYEEILLAVYSLKEQTIIVAKIVFVVNPNLHDLLMWVWTFLILIHYWHSLFNCSSDSPVIRSQKKSQTLLESTIACMWLTILMFFFIIDIFSCWIPETGYNFPNEIYKDQSLWLLRISFLLYILQPLLHSSSTIQVQIFYVQGHFFEMSSYFMHLAGSYASERTIFIIK